MARIRRLLHDVIRALFFQLVACGTGLSLVLQRSLCIQRTLSSVSNLQSRHCKSRLAGPVKPCLSRTPHWEFGRHTDGHSVATDNVRGKYS